jgi:hypothetical protein
VHAKAGAYNQPASTTQALAHMRCLGYLDKSEKERDSRTIFLYKVNTTGKKLLQMEEEKQLRALYEKEKKIEEETTCCMCVRQDSLTYFREKFYCPHHLNEGYTIGYTVRRQSSLALAQTM